MDRAGTPARARSRRPAAWLIGALLAGGLLLACASSPPPMAERRAPAGTLHVVRPGETLWRISRRYGVSVDELVRANRIADVTAVPVGTHLRIPAVGEALPPPPVRTAAHPPTAPTACDARREAGLVFAWPVRGTLTSRYGRRGRGRHEGIDIAARRGTPIRAAEAGRVIHSGGGLGDYGNVVIVKHARHWATVYAHTRRNLVRKGEFVEKGQVIAEVGTSGNATGPHLHFEIRRADRPSDPLRCLPRRARG